MGNRKFARVGICRTGFLVECRQVRAHDIYREKRQNQRVRFLVLATGVVALLAIAAAIWAWNNATLARAHLDRQLGLLLLQEAYVLKEEGDVQGAIEKFRAAQATGTDLGIDVAAEIEDVRRQVATRLIQEGEVLAKGSDYPAAEAKFKAGPSPGATARRTGLRVRAGRRVSHGGRSRR